jgi:hypothetical protein
MKLDVFGRKMQIFREGDQWIVFLLGDDGKKRLMQDVAIPSELKEEQILQYISDMFHELATPERPEVKRV